MTLFSLPKQDKDHILPNTLEDLSERQQGDLYLKAREFYNNLISLQFQLSYHANISIRDLDCMPRYEYLAFYNELVKQKEAEKKSMEESMEKAKSKSH